MQNNGGFSDPSCTFGAQIPDQISPTNSANFNAQLNSLNLNNMQNRAQPAQNVQNTMPPIATNTLAGGLPPGMLYSSLMSQNPIPSEQSSFGPTFESFSTDSSVLHPPKENRKKTLANSGDRAFKCLYCPKAFNRQEHLTRHTRIHTGEKPYHCRSCEKKFARQDELSRHEKTHPELVADAGQANQRKRAPRKRTKSSPYDAPLSSMNNNVNFSAMGNMNVMNGMSNMNNYNGMANLNTMGSVNSMPIQSPLDNALGMMYGNDFSSNMSFAGNMTPFSPADSYCSASTNNDFFETFYNNFMLGQHQRQSNQGMSPIAPAMGAYQANQQSMTDTTAESPSMLFPPQSASSLMNHFSPITPALDSTNTSDLSFLSHRLPLQSIKESPQENTPKIEPQALGYLNDLKYKEEAVPNFSSVNQSQFKIREDEDFDFDLEGSDII